MTWPADRVAALRGALSSGQVLAIALRLESYGVGSRLLFGSSPALSSRDAVLDPGSLQVSETTLTTLDCGYGGGAISVSILLPESDPNNAANLVNSVRRRMKRGMIGRLLIGRVGDPESNYLPMVPVFLAGFSSGPHPDEVTLTLYDLTYALRSRPIPSLSAGGLPQSKLFVGIAGTAAEVATAYTAGDTSLILDDVANFELFDGLGVCLVQPDEGDAFYLRFSAVNSGTNTLTVEASAVLGTTAAAASVGASVLSCAYLKGHPLTVAQRILVSTGASTNGAEDVYPERAGFGLPADWIDGNQFRLVRGAVFSPASGSFEIETAIDAPPEDGLLWLQALLASLGAWLCVRQGQLAPRALQPLSSPRMAASIEINDSLIHGGITVEHYDQNQPFSYNKLTYISESQSGSSTSAATSLPNRGEVERDVSTLLRSNETACLTMLLGNQDEWVQYIPELVSLTIKGIYGLCVGDLVHLRTQQARGRLRSTVGGYDRVGMVVRCKEEPLSFSTGLTLAFTPLRASDD